MIDVSGAYNPYSAERKIGAEATFVLADPDAEVLATATATGAETFFSQISQTHDGVPFMSRRIATCEPDEWRLNGEYSTISDNGGNGEVGFWSATLSGADKSTHVVLTFTFARQISSKGFTVAFDQSTSNFAEDFFIDVYNDTTLLWATFVQGNEEAIKIVEKSLGAYNKVVFTFVKTNKPFRRIRVAEVVFGLLQFFNTDDIASLSLDYQMTIDSSALPSSRVDIKIDNSRRAYNFINPQGVYKYLKKGQVFTAYVLINGERVSAGRFYFDSARSDDNALTASITAYDKALQLDTVLISVGSSGTWTVRQALDTIIDATDRQILYDIDDRVLNRVVGRAIPPNTSAREALRLVAQAAKCACYFDRLEKLKFVELTSETAVDFLTNDKMEKLPRIDDMGKPNKVVVRVKDDYAPEADEVVYTAQSIGADEVAETLEISNPLVVDDSVAVWLLGLQDYFIGFDADERGNPAREVGDCVNITDIYGGQRNCIVTEERFDMAQGLKGRIKAVAKR